MSGCFDSPYRYKLFKRLLHRFGGDWGVGKCSFVNPDSGHDFDSAGARLEVIGTGEFRNHAKSRGTRSRDNVTRDRDKFVTT